MLNHVRRDGEETHFTWARQETTCVFLLFAGCFAFMSEKGEKLAWLGFCELLVTKILKIR